VTNDSSLNPFISPARCLEPFQGRCIFACCGDTYYTSRLLREEYRMDTNRSSDDDDRYEEAKLAIQTIRIILADFPLRWQIAILKALGARTAVLREQQQEKPPTCGP
jgi:hypothetical protein